MQPFPSSTFESNEGNRGILFVIQNSVGIRGNTVFRDNTGPALRVSAKKILRCLNLIILTDSSLSCFPGG